jgi:hypothetical protein
VEKKITGWKNFGIHFSQSFGECAYIYILCYFSWGRIHVYLYLLFLEGYIATVCCHYVSCEAHLNCLIFCLSTVWGQGAAFLPWIVKNILYQAFPQTQNLSVVYVSLFCKSLNNYIVTNIMSRDISSII